MVDSKKLEQTRILKLIPESLREDLIEEVKQYLADDPSNPIDADIKAWAAKKNKEQKMLNERRQAI